MPVWFKTGVVVFVSDRNGFGRVQDAEGDIYSFNFRSYRCFLPGFLHPVFGAKRSSRPGRRPRLGDRLVFTATSDRHGLSVAHWSFHDDYAAVAAQMKAPRQLALV
jgi:hypothetical protein